MAIADEDGSYFKFGYIDKTGELRIPLEFAGAENFTEGLAVVEINKKWGYIDKTGKLVVPAEFDYIMTPFSEGLALVKKGEELGFIDKKGKVVIKLQFGGASSFQEGLAVIGPKPTLR